MGLMAQWASHLCSILQGRNQLKGKVEEGKKLIHLEESVLLALFSFQG